MICSSRKRTADDDIHEQDASTSTSDPTPETSEINAAGPSTDPGEKRQKMIDEYSPVELDLALKFLAHAKK